jgi:DNA-binding NarL/FixJ family response regulator
VLKVLLLSLAGTPRPELIAFLKSIQGLMLLDIPCDASSLRLVETPDLIVLDANAGGGGVRARLRQFKTWLPDARWIVLVRTQRQFAAAREGGADRVLLSGFSAAEFWHALEGLET